MKQHNNHTTWSCYCLREMLFHTNFMVQRLKRSQDGFVPSFWADTISTAKCYLRKQSHTVWSWAGALGYLETVRGHQHGCLDRRGTAVDLSSARKSWCHQMSALQIRCRIFLHWGKPSESKWLCFLEVCYAVIFQNTWPSEYLFFYFKICECVFLCTSHLTF